MEIRLLRENEESKANTFNNTIYHKSRTIEQWRWEFADNTYSGKPVPYALVDDSGRIAGTQAFIPIQLIDKDGVFWSAKSEETIVDPEYRGKQLFDKMYKLLFDYAEQHRFAFVWGFTPATKAFHKLQFETPCSTSQIFFPFSSDAISLLNKVDNRVSGVKRLAYKIAFGGAAARSRIKKSLRSKSAGINLAVLESAPAEAGALCELFIRQWGGITIYRDQVYFDWRLYKNPYLRANVIGVYHNDKLAGWIAFTMDSNRHAYIVDLLVAGEFDIAITHEITVTLLLEALDRVQNMGAVAIRGWHVNNHPFDLLVKQTALSLGFYHIKQGHHMVLYRTPGIYEKPFTIDNWYVTRIYTEGVLG